MPRIPLAGSLLAFAILTVAAHAQRPPMRSARPLASPIRRPVTSPYLNLLGDNGRSFTFNYFRRVRPEQEFRRSDAQLNRSVQRLDERIEQLDRPGTAGNSVLGPTGHAVQFQSPGNYFPLLNR